MLANYLPVLIFLTVATGLALVLMSLGLLIGRWQARNKDDKEKLSAYECGFEAFEDSRMNFDVRYYLVAILFIVFDIEAVLIYPWALQFSALGWAGLATMASFLALIVVALAYVWKKGALEWES